MSPPFLVPSVWADISVPLATVREPVSIFISPAAPEPLVSTVSWLLLSRFSVSVSAFILPPFPYASVEAVIFIWSIVRFWVSMEIFPALPSPVVLTDISPSPVISIVSEAIISIFPPLPVDVVLAEIKPWLLKLMSRSGLL